MQANDITIGGQSVKSITLNGDLLYKSAKYEELEWIQSNGTQYIDTGITTTNDVGLWCDFTPVYNTDNIIMGESSNSENVAIEIFLNGARLHWIKEQTPFNSWIPEDNIRGICSVNFLNDRKCIDRDIIIAEDLPALNESFKHKNIMVFAGYWGYRVWYFSHMICYRAKISKDKSIIRDLIPCCRLSDGAIGMYDNISKQFFENLGTGEFIAGPSKGILY